MQDMIKVFKNYFTINDSIIPYSSILKIDTSNNIIYFNKVDVPPQPYTLSDSDENRLVKGFINWLK